MGREVTQRQRSRLADCVHIFNFNCWPVVLMGWPLLVPFLHIHNRHVETLLIVLPIMLMMGGIVICRGRCPLLLLERWLRYERKSGLGG